MKIKFPFKVKQVKPNEVEVEFEIDGRPILEWQLHPAVQEAMGPAEQDALYEEVLGKVVKASIKVS